jgi:hypothetical protein
MKEVNEYNSNYCNEAKYNVDNYTVEELKLKKDIREQTLN